MMKMTMTKWEDFSSLKKFLCDRGDKFEMVSVGMTEKIIHKGDIYTYVDLSETAGRGFHVSKLLRRDVDEWLLDDKNRQSVQKHNEPFREQMFNIGAIEKAINYPSVAIDINDCYWNTAYKLGYITKKTHISGRRKKQWKTGRNASIGSLIKTETIVPYENGKPDYNKRKSNYASKEHRYVRNHIIGHVHDMFFRLYEQLGPKFYMFLVDCIYTSYDNQKYIEKYFEREGYKVKSKPIDFLYVDRTDRYIWWHDYNYEEEDDAGNIIKNGKDTYCIYGHNQMLDGIEPIKNEPRKVSIENAIKWESKNQ